MTANREPVRCPDCGGSHIRFARKAEQPKHFVVWKWFLVCESCGPQNAKTSRGLQSARPFADQRPASSFIACDMTRS